MSFTSTKNQPRLNQFLKTIYSPKLLFISSVLIVASVVSPLALAHQSPTNCPTQQLSYGSRSDCVRQAQAKLVSAGFMQPRHTTGNFLTITDSAVRNFQAARGLSVDGYIGPNTWRALNNGSTSAQPAASPISINFSKSDNQLRVYRDGQVIMQMDGRQGGSHYDESQQRYRPYPTDEGTFAVQKKYPMLISKKYNDAEMPFSLCYNGSECIHYSADFAARGYSGSSHGCINIRNYEQMKQLYNMTSEGTNVTVRP